MGHLRNMTSGRRLRAAGVCAALTLAALFLTSCGQKAPPASAFSGYIEDTTREILLDAPELATQSRLSADQIGGDPIADRLDDRSALAVDLRRGAALRRWAQIRAVDRATLSPDDQTTFDVLSAAFRNAAEGARFSYGRFSQIGGFSPYVLNPLDSAFVTLPGFFERDVPVASLADGEIYVRRLEHVADALDAEIDRARADARAGVVPPDFLLDRGANLAAGFVATAPGDLPYVAGLRVHLEALVGPLSAPTATPTAAPAPDTPDQARARALLRRAETIATDKILPAYRRTAQALAELRARAGDAPGVWRLPDGDAYYRAALKAATSTDYTPDQIHQIGLQRVKQVSGELDMMLRSQGLTEGSVGQRMATITADPRFAYPPTPEGQAAALADARARLAAVESKLRGWFSFTPKLTLDIRPAPAYAAGAFAGGYYEAPPLTGGPGVLTLNLGAQGGLNKIDLPTLIYHEGEPGHHLQTDRARAMSGLPTLRRLVSFNSYTEGWAVYAEQLADEMGLYDGDPYGRLGYLRWQMWRAARLVVDTGIHAQHWTREQAAAYLQDVTGDSPAVIELEIERYVENPGQACGYELGREEIVRLRDEARTALGPRFAIRDFHDVLLNGGALPPGALETRVGEWLAGAGAGGSLRSAR